MKQSFNLKARGFKITAPRRKILAALENATNKHLSAEDLYWLFKSAGENIGLATIYRVLAQFEMAGIVIKHQFEDEKRFVFELVIGKPHDHLICSTCSKIIEFFDNSILDQLKKIVKQHNYNFLEYSLRIMGICNDCK